MNNECLQILLQSVLKIERHLQEWGSGKCSCAHCPQTKGDDVLEWMDQQQVLAYLGISRSNFYVRKKEGVLVPRKMGIKDYFSKADLREALDRSIRKGKV